MRRKRERSCWRGVWFPSAVAPLPGDYGRKLWLVNFCSATQGGGTVDFMLHGGGKGRSWRRGGGGRHCCLSSYEGGGNNTQRSREREVRGEDNINHQDIHTNTERINDKLRWSHTRIIQVQKLILFIHGGPFYRVQWILIILNPPKKESSQSGILIIVSPSKKKNPLKEESS